MLRDTEEKKVHNGWKIIDYDNRRFLGLKGRYHYSNCRGATLGWTPPEVDGTKPHQIFNGKGNYFSYGYDICQIGLLYIITGSQPYQLNEKEKKKWNLYRYWYKKKLLKGGKYNMNSDNNEGEIWIRNYILSLYVKDKISKDLLELLDGCICIFDPRKRADCKQLYFDKWFDSVRE